MSNVIDLTNFLEVVGDDHDLKLELFGDFITCSEENLQEMRKAISLSDYSLWKKNAHSLKGASKNLGAMTLAEAASEVEQVENAELWPGLLKLIEKLFLEVKNYLASQS